MSYEILYGRQFIDLGDGRYIPLILSGSSNCTMFQNGREVMERHWGQFGPYQKPLALNRKDLTEWIASCVRESPKSEWFMRSGKWLLGEDMLHWMESGIDSARTIDDIAPRAGSLHCSIYIYNNSIPYGEKGHCRYEGTTYVKTTEELEKWLELYEETRARLLSTESICPSISFSSLKPLGLGTKPKPNTPVVCKCGKHYLSDYKVGWGYSCSSDSDEAIIFESEEDFKEKTKGLRIGNYHLIAPPKPKKDKTFAVQVASGPYNGCYVEKLSRSRLHFSHSFDYARRFTTEKEAERYIKEKLEGRFSRVKDFVVVKTEKE